VNIVVTSSCDSKSPQVRPCRKPIFALLEVEAGGETLQITQDTCGRSRASFALNMHPIIAISLGVLVATYVVLQLLLQLTQSKREPRLLESTLPFLNSAIGIFKHRANYLANLR